MPSNPVYLAVDIGGTKVASGLVSATGEVLSKTRVPMSPQGSAEEGLTSVKAAINQTLKANPGAEIAGIGICSPGPLDPRAGIVTNPPNLPCWRNFPLAEAITKHYRLPTSIDNDANAAGLAEAMWGSGRGFTNVFYTTIGTGIGTGIVFDGKIYHGRTGAAAEAGHMTIDYHAARCGCGKRGCIEALASGPAIAARARDMITKAGTNSGMLELAKGDISGITTEIVAESWRGGDALATEVLRETADLLTIWFGNVIDALEPDVIVVGGGVGELISNWFPQISEHLPKWSINQRCSEIPLKHARYSADAGLAGAAALCLTPSNAVAARK